ncbi:2795_t:CDS:1, partial [Acaulospora morrowiae]
NYLQYCGADLRALRSVDVLFPSAKLKLALLHIYNPELLIMGITRAEDTLKTS